MASRNEIAADKEPPARTWSYELAALAVGILVAALLETLMVDQLPEDWTHRLVLYAAIGLVALASGHLAGRLVANKAVGVRYGQRVRVRSDKAHGPGPWPAEPYGVITSLRGRVVVTTSGSRRMYWVRFDVPQRDADGDGPYEAAEVLEDYLEEA